MSNYWGRQLIAKKDTWFKYGTVVFVVDDYGDGLGLFHGKLHSQVCQDKIEYATVVCSFDDFYNIPLLAFVPRLYIPDFPSHTYKFANNQDRLLAKIRFQNQ